MKISPDQYKALCKKWGVRCEKKRYEINVWPRERSRFKPTVCVTVSRIVGKELPYRIYAGAWSIDETEVRALAQCMGFALEYRAMLEGKVFQ